MTAQHVRVWVEELEPPRILLFTWNISDETTSEADQSRDTVLRALRSADGVVRAEEWNDGVLVEIEPEETSRYLLATAIRTALDPDGASGEAIPAGTRVWAEDLAATRMRITWRKPGSGVVPASDEQRLVAAWLAVTPGVRSASPDREGALLSYDADRLDRSGLADVVREALRESTPLRERADQLMKRAPAYGNLARKLAMDDRVSPLPDAAKQAMASRAGRGAGRNMAAGTVLRFIPGAAWITRIQTLLPMLTELSKWSREANPEIVDEHLTAVGLNRRVLRADTITAHEIRHFARDSALETGADLGERATAGARQAISAGKGLLESVRESMRSESTGATPGSESQLDASSGHEADSGDRPEDVGTDSTRTQTH